MLYAHVPQLSSRSSLKYVLKVNYWIWERIQGKCKNAKLENTSKSSELGFVMARTFKYMQVNAFFSVLAFPLR